MNDRLNELQDRYFKGGTSTDEERELHQLLKDKPQNDQIRDLLDLMQAEGKERLGEDFEMNLLKRVEGKSSGDSGSAKVLSLDENLGSGSVRKRWKWISARTPTFAHGQPGPTCASRNNA